jgi:hypothetical protein
VEEFLSWTYKSEEIRPTFHQVQYVYSFKTWFSTYGISMKDHSQFRAFQLNYDVTANNVALFYKQSSLDISWNGLNSASIFGILLFHKFSHVTNIHNYWICKIWM